MIDEDALVRLAGQALALVSNSGVFIETTCELEALNDEMRSIGKKRVQPTISPELHDFTSGEVLGVRLSDGDGNLIGGMSARYLDLGKDTLADHLNKSYNRLYGERGEKKIKSSASALWGVSGKTVYQGELFLDEKWRGGQANVCAIMHYVHAVCCLRWHPAYIYGFMRWSGLHAVTTYGFHHFYLTPQIWGVDVEDRGEEEILVISSFDEVCEMCSNFARRPELFESFIRRALRS